MKKLILLLAVVPTLSFAVSNKAPEPRESRPAKVTILERCTSLRYRYNRNYLRCQHEKRQIELERKRRRRNSIQGRSSRHIGNYRGSRGVTSAVFKARPKKVSKRKVRTFSGTKRFSTGSYKKKTPNSGIYRGTLRRSRSVKTR